MSQTEVTAAIAEQEETIKRIRSCGGQVGLAHLWKEYPARLGTFEACTRCRVTRTHEGFRSKWAHPVS